MQPQNHASRPKGIPKTKLQGSGPSGSNTLQSQIAQSPKNRLTFNRLAVVHGRLEMVVTVLKRLSSDGSVIKSGKTQDAQWTLAPTLL
jgi:hypothetical protein